MSERRALACEVVGGRALLAECRDRVRGLAVPVAVERGGSFVYDRPDRDHVEVAEVRIVACVEIRIADIAPPDHGDRIVDDE